MPPEKKQSKLAAKLGAKAAEAVTKHANDDTTYGFINLPGGIKQGVAQLKKCYFDEYKKGPDAGKMYFRAQGQVVSPITHATPDGVMRTKGLMTSVMIPCCDTKKKDGTPIPVDEHIANVMLEMRRLGGENYTEGATINDLEGLAAALEEAKPFFIFSTTELAPRNPTEKGRVFENWHGTKNLPPNYSPPVEEGEAGGMVEDPAPEGAEAPDDDEPTPEQLEKTMKAASPKPDPKKPAPAKQPTPAPTKAPPPPPKKPVAKAAPEPEPDPEPDTPGVDLDALAADAADDQSDTQEASAKRLVEIAVEVGISEEDAHEAPSWDDLVTSIREHEAEADGDDAPDAEGPTGPAVGDKVKFKPTDPKTKKPGKEIVCDVTAVNGDGTLILKSGKAVYKTVDPDAVSPVE